MDISQANALVLRYQKLAFYLAKSFYISGMDREDIEQSALLALVAASRAFDENGDANFPTFATRCIRNELARLLRDATGPKRAATFETDLIFTETGESVPAVDNLIDHRERSDGFDLDEFIEKLFTKVGAKARLVIVLQFIKEETRTASARRFKVADGRITQMRRRAMERLQLHARASGVAFEDFNNN